MSQTPIQLQNYAAKLLAKALTELFPKVELVHSGEFDGGFAVDFISLEAFDDFAIKGLEERLRQLFSDKSSFEIVEMVRENVRDLFNHRKQPHLANAATAELSNVLSLVRIGDHYDFAVDDLFEPSNDLSVVFRLLPVEKCESFIPGRPAKGGLKKNAKVELLRIRGVAAFDAKDLKKQVRALSEYESSHHLNLGKELKLFSFDASSEERGCYWLPKGQKIKEELKALLQNALIDQRYQQVSTPEYSFIENEGASSVKIQLDTGSQLFYYGKSEALRFAKLFSLSNHSLKDFPVKYFEWKEKISEVSHRQLRGLLNARAIETDEEAIFCLPAELEDELISSLQLIVKIVKILSFECQWILHGIKQNGVVQKSWGEPVKTLVAALEKVGIAPLHKDALITDDGPKLVCMWRDSIGRQWEGSTIAFHLTPPFRQGLKIRGDTNQNIPYGFTQSVFSSLERVVGLLLESTEGALPLGIAPEQIRVLPKTNKCVLYAKEVQEHLQGLGFRCHLDSRPDKIQAKQLLAEKDKIPVILSVSEADRQSRKVNVLRFNVLKKDAELQSGKVFEGRPFEGLQNLDECVVQLIEEKRRFLSPA